MFDKLKLTNITMLKDSGFSEEQTEKVLKIKNLWNFYEGYHWEDMPETETNEITFNYCRAFVDKFVSFELGRIFSISTHKDLEQVKVTDDGRTLFEYLEDVWEDNNQYLLTTEIGQMKSITGDAWIQVKYSPADESNNIYNEYPDGRVEINLIPTNIIFPNYNPHKKNELDSVTILYSFKRNKKDLLGREKEEDVIFKQVWDKEKIYTKIGEEESTIENKYKEIPFVQIKNLPVAGKNDGRSDIEDIIPINIEYNLKMSDISEIIDYHSSPITIVYGANIGNLEKGANKMWGGINKDARVENLEMQSDLGASLEYSERLRLAMCEIGGVPDSALGGAQAISNTSGVALQYINLPLVEKTRIKKTSTETGLEKVNKLIILISVLEGLIKKPDNINPREFYFTEVKIPDSLPKDTLMELQEIQVEMSLGFESVRGAMKRLGKENIEDILDAVKKDKVEFPEIIPKENEINSGVKNGENPQEIVRKELTGFNKAIDKQEI